MPTASARRTLVGPVLIPASVTSIGEGSFEYAIVRLAAADAVVHITSDQLISCFLEDVEMAPLRLRPLR